MNTIKVHGSVLYRLAQALAADFATEEALNQKEIAYNNMPDEQIDRYMYNYDKEVDLLVDNMSKVLGSPAHIKKLFRNAGTGLQLSLIMRHEDVVLACLGKDYKDRVFMVPKQLDELFKLLFIDGYRSLEPFLER